MKKLLGIVLAGCLAVSMTACGGSSKPAETTKAAETKAEETKAEETKAEETKAEETKAAPAEAKTLKLGSMMPENVPEGEALAWFAEQVEERTGGAVKIDVYPNEQLGDGATMIDMTKLGTCDFTINAATNFSTYNSFFSVGSVPFLYKDNSIAAELNQGDIGKQEQESLRENGLQLVNTARNFYRGPYRVLVSKEPVESVDDVAGLRFRAYENEVYVKAWEALGANPIIVAWSETYSALQQGTVDAATSTIGQLYGVKFTEVAPYVTRINEYSAEAILVANAKMWDSLGEENQKIITECANEMGDVMAKKTEEALQGDIDKMADGGAVFSDIDTDAFREKLKDFYYDLEKQGKLPAGLVDKALSVK